MLILLLIVVSEPAPVKDKLPVVPDLEEGKRSKEEEVAREKEQFVEPEVAVITSRYVGQCMMCVALGKGGFTITCKSSHFWSQG